MPHELIVAPGHDPRVGLGRLAVAWIEAHCVHGPGDVQGDPVVLDEELFAFTAHAYASDCTGRRLYDSAVLSRPKGRDKSGHAGRLVLFEAFGPCRVARDDDGKPMVARGGEVYRWGDFVHEYRPGEMMGAPVRVPLIRCLATEESQAGNTYDVVHYNLTEGPLAEGLPSNAAGLTRTALPGGGEIVPSSSGDVSKDGGRETFCVIDESHLLRLPAHRNMVAMVRRNLGKRKAAEPWSLETTTMFAAGEGSVAEDTFKFATLIREGKVRRNRLLFDHREAPELVDMADEDELRAALVDVYGPASEWMDIDRLIGEIWDPRNSPEDSRRYWLNQRSSAVDSWIYAREWTPRAAARNVERHEPIVLGFDGSRSRAHGVADATALVACTVADGYVWPVGIWEQPPGPAAEGEWEVPVHEVLAAVDDTFRRHNVVGMFADPAKWETHVAGWEAAHGSKLRAKSTREHPIQWWMTGGRVGLIVRAVRQFADAVFDGELTHSGDPTLTKHVLNARRRETSSGITIAKRSPDSPDKIDAAVAAVLAWQCRIAALSAGVGQSSGAFVPRRIR